ncbi:MAG TPA: RNA pseudouridine synthase, partial [Desulfobulbaceae bacterium]|nr:RNA pseudouridine synthase [Desulfobulbaceae bacterium]
MGADELRIRLLYVDADLIVVEKPAGLLSVPGRGPD